MRLRVREVRSFRGGRRRVVFHRLGHLQVRGTFEHRLPGFAQGQAEFEDERLEQHEECEVRNCEERSDELGMR